MDKKKSGKKAVTEHQYQIDLRELKRKGLLKPGRTGELRWKDSKPVNYTIAQTQMTLEYGSWVFGFDRGGVVLNQTIQLDYTPCYYGGKRTWFLCPNCGKRCVVLYGVNRTFLCRKCHGLTYACQNETQYKRTWRKVEKLLSNLGITLSNNCQYYSLHKPKGMWQETFERKVTECKKYEKLLWELSEQ